MRLNRRTFLRGAGVGGTGIALGLPVLDAMLDGNGDLVARGSAQPAGHPLSLITFFFPCGVRANGADWHPETYGDGYRPRRNLGVLFDEGVADRCMPVGGLEKHELLDPSNASGDAHIDGLCTFTTGRGGLDRSGPSGPSLDHVIASRLGGDSRIRLLPVALSNDSGDPGFKYASWSGDRTPVVPYRDPNALYDELFGAGPVTVEPSTALLARRQSVLDFVSDDLRRLTRRVGQNDLRRLDQHFTSIREIERAMTIAPPMVCEVDRPGETHDDLHGGLSPERGELLMRLMVKGFECGLTRFGSFMLCGRADIRQFSWNPEIGSYASSDGDEGHHAISHYEPDKLTLAVEEQLREFATLVKLLRDTPVGDRDLLYHSCVFMANEHGDGPSHDHRDIPIILAGEAGGQIRQGGRAFRYEGGAARYSRIFFNLLGYLGLDDVDFGDPEHYEVREPLAGLEG
jgi:hypothetical protein